MRETRLRQIEPEAPGRGAAARLSRRVADVAGRLARLLSSSPLARENAVADGRAFLQAMAEASAERPRDAERGASQRTDALDRLVEGIGLSPFEVDLLLLAGMPEEHEGYGSVLRSLHPRGEPRATAGLAAQLFCEAPPERFVLREVLELGVAARSGLLSLGEGPFFERSLLVADSIWPVLAGVDVWPAWLRPLHDPVSSSGLQDWLARTDVARARAALRSQEPRLLLVLGESEHVAQQRAAVLAADAGIDAVQLALPADRRLEAEHLAGLHALARGAVPIVRLPGPDGPALAEVPEFRECPGPVIVCARVGAVVVRGARPVLTVPVERLSSSARRRLWEETLPELRSSAPTLAARYGLEPATAAEVALDVRSLHTLHHERIALEDVAESVRTRTNLSVSGGVKLVRPLARWSQLILPAEQMQQLQDALDRLTYQAQVLDEWRFLEGRPGARGVRMLFSGPSGTGKTLAAEVLACGLGVDLLVADISRVVSKWIGETEKNLAEIFDAAEGAQAVLLFDEADALFGRRTEVSDAHDRYANLETAYLLSRLERFEGLAILSTNLRQNIDPAFVRRLEFAVDFEEPSAAEREALWRCHLPPDAPLAASVGLPELAACYPIVGGLIRNASVAAGFLAAAEGTSITGNHLVRAIRREYEKSGKAFPGVPAGVVGL
jgi:hypothetical protein